MARSLSHERQADAVRDICLDRLDMGRPRPSIEELCELVRPHCRIDAQRMRRIVRELIVAGEVPDGGISPDEAAAPAPRRALYFEHMARERRIGIGGSS